MGYTNYWTRPSELTAAEFSAASKDCAEILPKLGVEIDADFDDDVVIFDSPGCETFAMSRVAVDPYSRSGPIRGFCKTGRAAGDLCVKVALLLMGYHLGNQLSFRSDGDCDEDWAAAREIVTNLGYRHEIVGVTAAGGSDG
ncbi:MAG: hypothetical protein WC992_03030 [Acholeplasmataceae bacterium]